jgi:hypothetical protein
MIRRHDLKDGDGKRKGVRGEYDQSTLHIYENSTVKPTENCSKEQGGGRD